MGEGVGSRVTGRVRSGKQSSRSGREKKTAADREGDRRDAQGRVRLIDGTPIKKWSAPTGLAAAHSYWDCPSL